MSLIINKNKVNVSDPNGDWHGLNMVVEESADEQISKIESAGQEVLDSIPADYTEVVSDVSELREDIVQQQGRIEALDNLIIRIKELIEGGHVDAFTCAEIENLIVEYFENKTVSEVER